jgi:hypothetical protein
MEVRKVRPINTIGAVSKRFAFGYIRYNANAGSTRTEFIRV